MMKKQRLFPLLLAILLFVPLLGGASASEASESETSAPVGEAFSTTEYVLNRDDDYYHFSSITDVQIRGYIGGDLIGFSYAPKVSATIDGNLRFAATALEVSLSGRVDGDVNVQADRVTFLNGFSCTGSIRVTAKEVEFGPVDAAVVEWQQVTTGSEIGGQLLELLYSIPAQILIVLLLLFLLRKPFGSLCAGFNRDKVKIALTGLAGLFIPILAIFLLLTMIGMPVSLLLLAGYFFLFFICEPIAAILIAGAYINMENKYLAASLVITGIMLLKLVPFLSEAVTLVCFVLTLGTLLRAAFRRGPSVPPPELGGFQV